MKKSIAMLLSLAMAASLTACGGGSKPAETPAPESTTTAAAADTSEEAKTEAAADGAEDPFAALGDFVMTVGHAQPEGNPRYVSMEKFAADVAEKTNGHVTVEVYGNGQLGTEKEMLEQVVAGTIQGMRGGQFDFSPRLLMFTLPFLTQQPRADHRFDAERSGEESLHRGRGRDRHRDSSPCATQAATASSPIPSTPSPSLRT